MRKPFLYVARDGELSKIGATVNVERRAVHIGVEMVKVWKRPYAFQIESSIKGCLAWAAVRGTERFSLTIDELLLYATRSVRIWDDDWAMKLGFEPSPLDADPPYEPPFELEGECGRQVAEHFGVSPPTIYQHWLVNRSGEGPRYTRLSQPK